MFYCFPTPVYITSIVWEYLPQTPGLTTSLIHLVLWMFFLSNIFTHFYVTTVSTLQNSVACLIFTPLVCFIFIPLFLILIDLNVCLNNILPSVCSTLNQKRYAVIPLYPNCCISSQVLSFQLSEIFNFLLSHNSVLPYPFPLKNTVNATLKCKQNLL
jgi:hypothetical protein